MYTIEQKVCIGLAWTYARDRRRMSNAEAYQWAESHWAEFLHEMDTPTGRMLLQIVEKEKKGASPLP